MYCTHCGAQSEGGRFCTNCGTPLFFEEQNAIPEEKTVVPEERTDELYGEDLYNSVTNDPGPAAAPVNDFPPYNPQTDYNPQPEYNAPSTDIGAAYGVYTAGGAQPEFDPYMQYNTVPPVNSAQQPNRTPPVYSATVPPQKNESSKKAIVAVCAALAVVAGIAAFIFFRPIPVKSIEFDKGTATIDVDSTYEVIYTVLPENNTEEGLLWTSSDESVATVKDGKITPVGEGECTIRAASKKGVSDKMVLTVIIEPKEIKMSQSSITLNMGGSQQLTAALTPEKVTDDEITWETDNEGVATVDDRGNVETKGLGTCTVTATASNGIKAECKVTVERPYAETLIIGEWDEDVTIVRATNETFFSEEKFVVNGDYTARGIFKDGTVVNFTWRFVKIDGDGDYKYTFKNSNGGTFDVFVIQDTANPNYGDMLFTMQDYLTWCKKGSDIYI
ncbi:MAG: Ig-like domain-containing protein [Clostridia bacterium]|nr:Ig-like domain-containing protein [Clostridia bacterium]